MLELAIRPLQVVLKFKSERIKMMQKIVLCLSIFIHSSCKQQQNLSDVEAYDGEGFLNANRIYFAVKDTHIVKSLEMKDVKKFLQGTNDIFDINNINSYFEKNKLSN